jgi:hypothetical protein
MTEPSKINRLTLNEPRWCSARRGWLWFQSERLPFPHQDGRAGQIYWISATYTVSHSIVLTPCMLALVLVATPAARAMSMSTAQSERARAICRWTSGSDP